MTATVTVKVPMDALRLFGEDPDRFGREMYETAVVRWFEEGRLSQGQAAEMLSLHRGEFFDVLYAHRVSPIQMTAEELHEDFRRG
jgi:predicted HTH domain antitoxin